jgi:hypothetical protein
MEVWAVAGFFNRHRWFCVGLAMFVVAVSAMTTAAVLKARDDQPTRAVQGPQLELSTHLLDLGSGKPNEVLRGTVLLRNTGSQTLEFSISGSCGCSEMDPRTGTINPGEESAIVVGVKLPEHANSERSVELLTSWCKQGVQGADRNVTRCVVVARCPAPFLVSPPFVSASEAGTAEVNRTIGEVHVTSRTDAEPLTADSLQVENASDTFSVEKVEGGQSAVLLRVLLAKRVAPGDYYDTIDLRIVGSESAIRVPVRLTVSDLITVVPLTAMLRTDPESGDFRPVDLIARMRDGELHFDDVRLIDGPVGVRIEAVGPKNAAHQRLRVLVDRDAQIDVETRLRIGWQDGAVEACVKLLKR